MADRRRPSRKEVFFSNSANVGLLPAACPVVETSVTQSLSASSAIDMTGALINYGAQRWANAQLEKVHRRTVSDDVWILAMDKNALGILKGRLNKLVKRKWEVDGWKFSSYNEQPDDVMEHNKQTVKSTKLATISTYDGLVSDMTALYAKFEGFIAEEGAKKSNETEQQELLTELKRLSPPYHLVTDNLEQVQKHKEAQEAAVAADCQESHIHTCNAPRSAACDCITDVLNKNQDPKGGKMVKIGPGAWQWEA